jgi:hypothetical protein
MVQIIHYFLNCFFQIERIHGHYTSRFKNYIYIYIYIYILKNIYLFAFEGSKIFIIYLEKDTL